MEFDYLTFYKTCHSDLYVSFHQFAHPVYLGLFLHCLIFFRESNWKEPKNDSNHKALNNHITIGVWQRSKVLFSKKALIVTTQTDNLCLEFSVTAVQWRGRWSSTGLVQLGSVFSCHWAIPISEHQFLTEEITFLAIIFKDRHNFLIFPENVVFLSVFDTASIILLINLIVFQVKPLHTLKLIKFDFCTSWT